ncbi:unnamed protein product [Moneuplotes crassus]|uniref:EF-hand domain-containing protein n=2 Tax=Euplotes crassus TaxID=5936 RepID=A0AAD1XPQ0_EUPCR|nr:unnamed protein product [Moneuplotes crassus]
MINPSEFTKEELEGINKTLAELSDPDALKEEVKKIFDSYDADENGYLDRSELKNFLNEISTSLKLKMYIDDTVVDHVFGTIDQDKNHQIELDELEEYVRQFVEKMLPIYSKALEESGE